MRGASSGIILAVGAITFLQLLSMYREYWKSFVLVWVLLALHFLLTWTPDSAAKKPTKDEKSHPHQTGKKQ